MQRAVVLTTSRLVLTSWLLDDVESLHEVHSDTETMRFVRNGRPETRAEVRRLVGEYIAEDAARGWTKWRLADLGGHLVGRQGSAGPLIAENSASSSGATAGDSGWPPRSLRLSSACIWGTRSMCHFAPSSKLATTQVRACSRRWAFGRPGMRITRSPTTTSSRSPPRSRKQVPCPPSSAHDAAARIAAQREAAEQARLDREARARKLHASHDPLSQSRHRASPRNDVPRL